MKLSVKPVAHNRGSIHRAVALFVCLCLAAPGCSCGVRDLYLRHVNSQHMGSSSLTQD